MMKDKTVILVVDDQLQNVELLRAHLVPRGYDVVTAASGAEAMEKISGNQIDLVLLDVIMPGMSGFEVLAKLRADKKTQRIPVIMITAYKEHEDRLKALESGCDDFISKPFDRHELFARVKSLLRIKSLHDEADEARDYAEAIVETVREPLLVLSKDLRVITANQAYYRVFKTTPYAVENVYFYDLQNERWNIPTLRNMLEDILEQNTTFNDFEVDYEAPGVGRRALLLNARRIDREGTELILLALEDITDRRLAEENIKKLNADLQHNLDELASANKELEAFSYSVSHDLRNPLNRILGFSDILLEGYSDKLDDEGKNHLDRIIKNAVRMKRIMDDLLHLSRISRKGVQRQDVDLSKIAASVVAELREAQPDRGATVDIQEGIAAFADVKLIEVALSNLLGNAWKFTSKIKNAGIQFGTFKEEGKIVYYVRDNGAGFDQRFSEKLFLPFHRLHSEDEFEGTGIGLATVQRIIHRHGGKVWAEGEPGKGAAFYFTLNDT
jgi:signal transduction histidine kinase